MENKIVIPTNSVTSDVTEQLLEQLDSLSKIEFMDIFERIVFVKHLTSPDRKRAKDLDKDKKGRVKVDLENPHILEDMDYFRERALYYQEHGVYTHIYPNSNPNSQYRKFWDEERRRCKEGYVRESDGEWIPGYYYFYLNYSPIDIVEAVEELGEIEDELEFADAFGGVRSERVEDFPHIWDGDYLYYHYIEQAEFKGEHGAVLKTRGRGFSFKGASMLARNYFIFKKSKSYGIASEQEYLTKDGLLTKTWSNINFLDNKTPFTQPRDYADRDMHKRASYKDITNKTEKGFMSEVIGVTCKDNPSKTRGKRGKLLLFEEGGKFPGLSTSWTIARKSVEQGRFVYGFMCAFGTGGTLGADFESLEKFFYSPSGYNIKALTNIFDKTSGTGECAFFSPEYLNRQGCYDKDGNSDVVKALIEVLINRQKIRNHTSDPSALIEEKAEAPITPQEAVLRVEGSLFPILDLKEYLADISPHMSRFTKGHYIGKFYIGQDGEVKFKMVQDIVPIREFPLKDINKEGAVEVFELPPDNPDPYRFIVGVDTYDDDEVRYSNSLGSAIVFDRYTRKIVAEYTGRPSTADAFYEIVYRLAKFYSARIMYEANKKGLYGYFNNIKKAVWMLADTPEYLKEKQNFKVNPISSNTSKGVNATAAINAHGRRMQASWQQEEYTEVLEETDESGEPKIITRLRLQQIRSIGYIKECITWNPDINTDRISAMNMVMVFDAELKQYEDTDPREKTSTSRFANDPFVKKFLNDKENRMRNMFSYSTS